MGDTQLKTSLQQATYTRNLFCVGAEARRRDASSARPFVSSSSAGPTTSERGARRSSTGDCASGGGSGSSYDGARAASSSSGPAAWRRLLFILRKASRSRHALRWLAVAHRLGAVPAGEASVFVAASATHRADPMEAYCYIVVELKASVPIWKEVYDDGEIWKENREFDRHSGHGNGSAGCCGSKVRVQEA